VPGSVAGFLEAHRRFGQLPLADVMAPAIRLAEEGVALDSAQALALSILAPIFTRFGTNDNFYPRGTPLAAGARLVQRDVARTLQQVAAAGASAFYQGEIADLLVAEMRRGGGVITKDDLARYQPIWRDPLRATYRGYSLIAMPLVSSGGTVMTQVLNTLEIYDPLPSQHSTRYTHLLAESLRRAFVDRNTKLCDPAFCQPPVDRLTSKDYARELSRGIDLRRASVSPAAVPSSAGMHTTHFSVVDAEGNAVATTTTLNSPFGSGVFVRGAGFLLNNEMDDFATAPGQPGAFGLTEGEQNRVEAGKRPLSSMSPSIVLDAAGNVLLVIGAAGGPTIITGTLQVILNVVEHRMTLADAMHAPRVHHQAWPDSLYHDAAGLRVAVIDSLRAMGHALAPHAPAPLPGIAWINAIMRVPDGWHGVVQPAFPAFPRLPAAALGY
jgi:gamma-glutamyltranspeptidase/glutathione hydrolase